MERGLYTVDAHDPREKTKPETIVRLPMIHRKEDLNIYDRAIGEDLYFRQAMHILVSMFR